MLVVILLIVFIFGAVIGSFLNVVSLRLNTGLGLDGRSMCMACGKTLTWIELIPIASFLIQGGKCRGCKSKVSWQYPIVEALTGILFATIVYEFLLPTLSTAAIVETALYLIATCLAIVITVYDVHHKIIPDPMVYAFDAIALASVFVNGASIVHAPHLWTILAGPILAAPFALLWLVSRGKWIGLGDAKLVLGIGWLLGLTAGVNALILSFWVAAIVSVIWMLAKYKGMKRGIEIPFGPFLLAGMYAVLIFGVNVLDLRMLASLF